MNGKRGLTPFFRFSFNSGYTGQMKTASISVTKNQLSALIEQVRHGETILITDHDRPVARLVPIVADEGQSGLGELERLERKGVLRRGHGKACGVAPLQVPAKPCSAVAALLEEREAGR